jgi:hypothetical protein
VRNAFIGDMRVESSRAHCLKLRRIGLRLTDPATPLTRLFAGGVVRSNCYDQNGTRTNLNRSYEQRHHEAYQKRSGHFATLARRAQPDCRCVHSRFTWVGLWMRQVSCV